MKTFKLILAVAVFAIGLQANAAIINVNNANPSPGQYSDLQDAIDAAVAGDSIYLAATSSSYGDVLFNKQLHFFGPGYIISNGILGNRAIVGEIHYTNGISGSSVTGIQLTQFYGDLAGQTTNNVTIQRCIFLEYIYVHNSTTNNWVIEGNVFIDTAQNLYGAGTNTGWTIRNNIFNGLIYSQTSPNITQNIFLGLNGGNTVPIQSSVSIGNITNNIFFGKNVSTIQVSNNISGNMSFAGSNNNFPGVGVNYPGVNPLFENYTIGLYTWAFDFHLAAGSPALGVGAGGLDLGVYAGDGIYRKDGEPTIPIIRSVNVPGGNVVPANSSFNINIISESHE